MMVQLLAVAVAKYLFQFGIPSLIHSLIHVIHFDQSRDFKSEIIKYNLCEHKIRVQKYSTIKRIQ